jgi:hypothetical protein
LAHSTENTVGEGEEEGEEEEGDETMMKTGEDEMEKAIGERVLFDQKKEETKNQHRKQIMLWVLEANQSILGCRAVTLGQTCQYCCKTLALAPLNL